MTCNEFHKIQAFIDAELSREERKQFSLHLEECRECQETVNEMKKLDQWCDMHMKNSLSAPHSTIINTDAAWERFQSTVKEPAFQRAGETKKSTEKWREKMNKSTKRWIVTAASIAILGGGLALPQVQSIASDFLSMFRLSRVEFVKLTQDDIQKVSNALSSDKKGSFDLKELGSIRTESTGKDQYFQSVSEAKKKGITIPKLLSGVTVRNVSKTTPRKIEVTLSTEKANQLLKQLKVTNVQLSNNLNNKTFILHTPEVLHFNFEKNGKDFNYTKFNAPKIEVETGVNVHEIRNVILALPFIPNSIKEKFVDPNNWKNTFLMPIYGDKQQTKEITLHGTKAIEKTTEYSHELMWQKDGTIHILTSYRGKQDRQLFKEMATQVN